MLYTIRQLRGEPIFMVQVLPPLHPHKFIHGIDCELMRLSQHTSGKIYRIDDLTRLLPYHFTYSDAVEWFTGPIREDANWRSNIDHMAVGRKSLSSLIPRLEHEHEMHIPIFPSLQLALSYTRLKITSQNARDE